MEEPQEVVSDIGPVVPRVQLLGQHEKGLGVVKEKAKFKDGFRVRDVILLKVAVEAAPWGSAERRKRLIWRGEILYARMVLSTGNPCEKSGDMGVIHHIFVLCFKKMVCKSIKQITDNLGGGVIG